MPKSAQKSQTARAIYTRQWRENNYKDKRFNKPLREYIQLKYNGIYDEYYLFFKSLDEQHPTAKDLTKTRTYRKWKKELLKHESSGSEDEQNSLPVEAGDRPEPRNDPAEPDIIDDRIEPRNDPAEPDIIDDRIEPRNDPAEPDIIDDRIEPRNDPAEPDIIDDRIEPRNDPAEPDIIDYRIEPRNDPTESDILTAAVQEILSSANQINININEVDNIIEEIINDLEQDNAIRDLLNAENNGELVHPQYEDEDEGIGLNVETELEAIFEPFDYKLEVEGFDF